MCFVYNKKISMFINKYINFILFLIWGTLQAAIQLLKNAGAEVVQALVIMELCDLEGRNKLDIPVKSFIQY